jgi:hypothetical protein
MVLDSLAVNLRDRKFPGRLNDGDSLKPIQYRQKFIAVGAADPQGVLERPCWEETVSMPLIEGVVSILVVSAIPFLQSEITVPLIFEPLSDLSGRKIIAIENLPRQASLYYTVAYQRHVLPILAY